ncbi:MAG: (2Fe-2S) ferredoxin domain-containing protein [Candidatus Marinimicrobia bacterium]|jgi:(2Fe-2S) ferredoxin|nr:(2Fe-2S) ferredoxin domain-containing protein [Candidatus Neomarinimicrobiota bacterium]MDP7061290.1 (2Fe-2S) ferredoxin domain-containing protein [Candidatus Neomarinimicrobiota bacterium]|tara:strand:+ start:2991 stop:3338 length:348 start_codon:yes stop_codon:yes gene_type:complete
MRYRKQIFVCTNERSQDSPKGCCASGGGSDIRYEFVKLINEHGLNGKVRSNKSGCLDACEVGPAVVIYPGGLWYTGVTVEDVPEIFEKSILNNKSVERLLSTQRTWDDLDKLRNV